MAGFDEIKKAGSAAGSAVTEGAVKVVKLSQAEIEKHRLKSLRVYLASAQQEMGALVYELVERGELLHPELEACQATISEALALVAEKEAEIATLKAEGGRGEETTEEVGRGEGTNGRDAYVEKLKIQLGEWSADIEKLKVGASRVSAEAKVEYEEQIAGLRKQRDSLASKVTDLQEASDEAWDEVKQGVQAAWERAKESFQKAMSRFG